MCAPDPLLLPYLTAPNDFEMQRHLERLVDVHVLPLVNGILGEKYHVTLGPLSGPTVLYSSTEAYEEAEAVRSEVLSIISERLYMCRHSDAHKPISQFREYVATLTFNVYHTFLRQKYPNRTRLSNQIHYLLTHRPRLARWRIPHKGQANTDSAGPWYGGFLTWQQEGRRPQPNTLRDATTDPDTWTRKNLPDHDVRQMKRWVLLEAIFNIVNAPVAVNDLITALLQLLGIVESGPDQAKAHTLRQDRLSSRISTSPENAIISRDTKVRYLIRLWAEVKQLPPLQSAALLLNLRYEGGAVIDQFPELAIASLRELATAMDIPLDWLLTNWQELPIEDKEIAALLNKTPDQVVNLRTAARRRLVRCMSKSDLEM